MPKKSEKWRFCFDERHLNDATLDHYFPLPIIEDEIDNLAGAYVFSTLDATSGYHQIKLEEASKPLTAFSTRQGHWEFEMLPFGIRGASHTFQRLMALMMKSLSFNEVLTYLDDVLVYSPTFHGHLASLSRVFDCLRQHGMKLKPEKCSFCLYQVKYLGYLISYQGISPDPSNVSAIVELPLSMHHQATSGVPWQS